jgi:hypothetical protein
VERYNAEFTSRLQALRDSLIVLQAGASTFASPSSTSAGPCALKSTLTRVWGETVALKCLIQPHAGILEWVSSGR